MFIPKDLVFRIYFLSYTKGFFSFVYNYQVSVDKNFQVLLKDASPKGLSRGMNQVYEGLDKSVKRKKISRQLQVDIHK